MKRLFFGCLLAAVATPMLAQRDRRLSGALIFRIVVKGAPYLLREVSLATAAGKLEYALAHMEQGLREMRGPSWITDANGPLSEMTMKP